MKQEIFQQIFERVPEIGSHTEIIFVEGHSQDNTFDVITENIAKYKRPAKVFQQTGKGKRDAIRLGFENASDDILMILDADLTVPPEDLPRFFDTLVNGKGDFINGVRLVYPMEKEAMRFFNFLGNKFFSLAFSWLLGQSIKETLCGTKVLWKNDYEKIAKNRIYFGDFDPFGDFDLIFGSAKLNHKIVDLPIRYRERTYGSTNIQRWKHGLLLLRMVWVAAIRLKFIQVVLMIEKTEIPELKLLPIHEYAGVNDLDPSNIIPTQYLEKCIENVLNSVFHNAMGVKKSWRSVLGRG